MVIYLPLIIIDIFEMLFRIPGVYMKRKRGVSMLLLKTKILKDPIIVKLKCSQVMWEACLKCCKSK